MNHLLELLDQPDVKELRDLWRELSRQRQLLFDQIYGMTSIPYPMLSQDNYQEWINWMIATGQLE